MRDANYLLNYFSRKKRDRENICIIVIFFMAILCKRNSYVYVKVMLVHYVHNERFIGCEIC